MNFYMVQFLLGQQTRPRQKLVQPTGQIHCFLLCWLFDCHCLAEELTSLHPCFVAQREREISSLEEVRDKNLIAAWLGT